MQSSIYADAISSVPFARAATAIANVSSIQRRVSPEAVRTLLTLLSESPDPDSALNGFERLTAEAARELLQRLEENKHLIHYAVIVLGYSHWLSDALLCNSDLFDSLERDRFLDRLLSAEDFRQDLADFRKRSLGDDISTLLARFKKREYIRIVLRDILGLATLAEITCELSALADVLIQEALREADLLLCKRYGPPQTKSAGGHLIDLGCAVLSMGKLGGLEVNYSSDIDLIFIHQDGERPEGEQISNHEYFLRLAQKVAEMLSRTTREGAVFRIDLRLRPQGHEGETSISFSQALRYYNEIAHDWELQALIKVRHSAGDPALAREFIQGVQPRVYKPELNFSAIETSIFSLQKIGRYRRKFLHARRRSGSGTDVKIDRGGIRDIEFLVQCLQRTYGGQEPWLKSGGTLFSLQKLHDKGHLSGSDFHLLTQAYTFLRTVEHRLQIQRGQQTHRLPSRPEELKIMVRAVSGGEGDVNDFERDLKRKMEAVSRVYDAVIHRQQHAPKTRETPSAQFARWNAVYAEALRKLEADSPEAYEALQPETLSRGARRNLAKLLSSAQTSRERYLALLRDPQLLRKALDLICASPVIEDILLRFPEEIAQVGHAVRQSENENESLLKQASGEDATMAALRHYFRGRLLESAAKDLMGARPAWSFLREATESAEQCFRTALAEADAPPPFVALAAGRLGTHEFDIYSDADVIFVAGENGTAKAAEKIVGMLQSYTREGTVFSVDTRLRPYGGEGDLVTTLAQLEKYFVRDAKPWEALSYTKARFLVGSRDIAEKALLSISRGLERFAHDQSFSLAVREMRGKLEEAADRGFDFKQSPGGFYDVDFIVTYLLVKTRTTNSQGTTLQRLDALRARKALSAKQRNALAEATTLYRTVDHAIRLLTGKKRHTLPQNDQAREAVARFVMRVLGSSAAAFDDYLRGTARGVREIYNQVLAA